MKSPRFVHIVFAALVVVVAATNTLAAPGDSATSLVAAVDRAAKQSGALVAVVEEGESPNQCQGVSSQAQAVIPESGVLDPDDILAEEPFDCWYCSGCSGSLVNPACCFHGNGNYFCVASCSSGCVGPVLPEP